MMKSINIKETTKEKLEKIASGYDSFDDVIQKLIVKYKLVDELERENQRLKREMFLN
jgi:predicted CopG family antitoxin